MLIGLFVWAEHSWNTTQAAMIASTEAASNAESSSSSSNIHSSGSSSGTSSSSNDAESSNASQSSSDNAAASGGSSSKAQSSDANEMNDGVARDTQTYTNSTRAQDGKTSAQVELSWWSADESGIAANGGVNNLIEEGGTCTLTASKGSASVTASSTSIANATTTSCGKIVIPRNKLSAGQWQIRLSYVSEKAAGTSSQQSVQLP